MRKILTGSLVLIIVYLAIQMTCNSAMAYDLSQRCKLCQTLCAAEGGGAIIETTKNLCVPRFDNIRSGHAGYNKCLKLGCTQFRWDPPNDPAATSIECSDCKGQSPCDGIDKL